jgi:hypothetical protein
MINVISFVIYFILKFISAWGILFFVDNINLENSLQTILCVMGILLILEFNLKSTNYKIEIKK